MFGNALCFLFHSIITDLGTDAMDKIDLFL